MAQSPLLCMLMMLCMSTAALANVDSIRDRLRRGATTITAGPTGTTTTNGHETRNGGHWTATTRGGSGHASNRNSGTIRLGSDGGHFRTNIRSSTNRGGGRKYSPPMKPSDGPSNGGHNGAGVNYNLCKAGSVCHDPVLVGFNNQRFEFHGTVGSVYSLISQKELQVNAQMMDLTDVVKNQGEKATFLGAVGIRSNRDQVAVHAVFGDKIEVRVNGKNLELLDMKSAAQVTTLDSSTVKLLSRAGGVPDTVQVSTAKLSLTITGDGHHLNMEVSRVAGGLCDMHGVLGQTYQGEEFTGQHMSEQAAKSGQFKPEGADNDYQVSGLFDTNSKFNRFGVEPKACLQAQR